jgi:fluoride exporter
MKQILLVFLGGGAGSAIRYLIGNWMPYSGKGFPWSTFTANVIGCFILGVFLGYIIKNGSEPQSSWVALGTIGFCGGFTTFSSFANENLGLIRSGDLGLMLTYTIISLIIGMGMIYLGFMFQKYF